MKRVVDIGDLAEMGDDEHLAEFGEFGEFGEFDNLRLPPYESTVRKPFPKAKKKRTAARAQASQAVSMRPMYGIGYVPVPDLGAVEDPPNVGDAPKSATEAWREARMWWAVFGVSVVAAVGVDIYFLRRHQNRKGR